MKPTADCSTPAPLLGRADPKAGGYIVQFRDGVAVQPEVDRLAAKYKFTARHVYQSALRGFSAELTVATLAGIRCEASVVSVEYDGTVTKM
jgi:hypothetical protein